MYINPFVCGVIATILAEMVIIVAAAVIIKNKEDKKNGKDRTH